MKDYPLPWFSCCGDHHRVAEDQSKEEICDGGGGPSSCKGFKRFWRAWEVLHFHQQSVVRGHIFLLKCIIIQLKKHICRIRIVWKIAFYAGCCKAFQNTVFVQHDNNLNTKATGQLTSVAEYSHAYITILQYYSSCVSFNRGQ